MSSLTIAMEKVLFVPPTRVTDDVSVLNLKALVLEPLLRWRDGRVGPGLLARWTVSPDGLRWRFELREGAIFHDGVPCRAEHVVAFVTDILRATDMFGMPWSYARYFADATFAVGPGDSVTVETLRPFADMPEVFTEFYPCRTDGAGRPVLGTGPYRVAEASDGRAALARIDRAGPGPERIVALAVPDAGERHATAASGRADIALNLERGDVRALERDGDLAFVRHTSTMSVIGYLDGLDGVFASPEARLGVNHAVDTARLVAEVMDGLGVPAATVVGPAHLGHAEAGVRPIPHDPDRARSLFDAVGAPSRLTLRTPDLHA